MTENLRQSHHANNGYFGWIRTVGLVIFDDTVFVVLLL